MRHEPSSTKITGQGDRPAHLKTPFTWKSLDVLSLAPLSLAIVSVATVIAPFLTPEGKFTHFQDDFFYYLQVAKNLAEHGRSTFDGITLTNGYHPLWLLLLTIFWFPGHGSAVFAIVSILILAGTAATYLLTKSLLEDVTESSALGTLSASFIGLFYISIARTGMEVILTIPLSLAFMRYTLDGTYLTRVHRILFAGLLASAVILSRLDSALMILLYGVVLVAQHPSMDRIKQAFWFLVGLAPLFFYFGLNFVVFGSFGPTSSEAKHMKHGYAFDGAALKSLFVPFGLGTKAFLVPAILLLLAGCVLLVRYSSSWRTPRYALLAALIIFPLIYYTLLSVSSDWRIWAWYRYPLVASSVAALLLLFFHKKSLPFLNRREASWFAVICVVTYCALFGNALRRISQNQQVYEVARRLVPFMAAHSGLYGMGDAAGTPAFISGRPVVQLEGLMMDKAYLVNIREQRPLLDVLRAYRIRYYVALDAEDREGCRYVFEPRQAGKSSPHMSATICQAPVDEFKTDDYRVSIFDLSRR